MMSWDSGCQALAQRYYILEVWHQSQIVLRLDNEFVDALVTSDTDVPLVPDWLTRLPFASVAVSLPTPLSLHDGHNLCHYMGFIATGIRHDPTLDRSEAASDRYQTVYTRYGPLTDGDGIRFLWLYTADQDPSSRCQTITVSLRGEFAQPDRTLTNLIAAQQSTAEQAGQHWGDEQPILVPLSVQVLLYVTAQEPDVDWVPPEQMSRPHQLRTAEVANLGWRVGAALRTWKQTAAPAHLQPSAASPRSALPPHIRRAHWHRVRVATRDSAGQIIGNTQGIRGIDWDYLMRWYPPTPVNAGEHLAPVVRQLDTHQPAT